MLSEQYILNTSSHAILISKSDFLSENVLSEIPQSIAVIFFKKLAISIASKCRVCLNFSEFDEINSNNLSLKLEEFYAKDIVISRPLHKSSANDGPDISANSIPLNFSLRYSLNNFPVL